MSEGRDVRGFLFAHLFLVFLVEKDTKYSTFFSRMKIPWKLSVELKIVSD